ncbi:MAG TPA: tetratricopeptide repeat protein [Clostridia bacterium]|nr:tetratricopeptide repeat protein [Clostridia bacterium]
MKKFYWFVALFIVIFISLSGCETLPAPSRMVKAPEAVKQIVKDNNVEDIILKLLPKGGKLITPQHPKGASPIQLVDIDEDGKEELLATYRINGVKLEVYVALFREYDGVWEEQWKISSPGYEIDWVEFADLSDLKQMELIVGVDPVGGSTFVKGVKIFTMEAGKPKEIYSTLYQDMEVIHSGTANGADNEDGLVLWFIPGTFGPTVEAYRLEKINNEYIPMPNSEGNQHFIKKILPQYEVKMDMLDRIRDSWKYFYCYADIMLKVDKPGLALGEIENGLDRVDSGGDRAKIKLLLLKAEAFNALGNSKKALEILEDALREIKSLGEDEMASGFETLLYLELVNTYNILKDADNARINYEKALEAGKKTCNERAYESAVQSDIMPFFDHYLKVDSIEKDFKAKFIYSIEKR